MSTKRHPMPMYCGLTGTALETQWIRKSKVVRLALFFSFPNVLLPDDIYFRFSSWPYRQKWAATIVVSSFTFISPVSSSMIAPAAAQVAEDLGITSNALVAMTTSIFILGYGEYYIFPVLRWPHHDSYYLLFSWIAIGPLVCTAHCLLGPIKY